MLAGVRAALRHATAAQILDCALEVDDPRVLRIAAHAVAKKRGQLAELDFTLPRAQAIWREAIAIDSNSWRAPSDPAAAFHLLLESLLNTGQADMTLTNQLAQTPLADLGSYARRSEVWSRVPDGARQADALRYG